MIKNTTLLLLVAALLLGACTENPAAPTEVAAVPASHFITVNNHQLMLGNKPYRFAGTNYWYGAYLGAQDTGRLRAELDLLARQGISNLRVLAVSEVSRLSRAVRPAMLQADGEPDETLLRGLDTFLAEAGQRNMKVVLYFTNFWQWSGGMTQYTRWYQNAESIDPDTSGRWNDYMEASAGFYRCAPCQQRYRQVIEGLINRTNSQTGVLYKNDPTIMSWQLANEPRPGGDTASVEHTERFIRWVHESAAYIKSLDPNHLVSTGNEGLKGSQENADTYLRAHQSPHIDYATVHLWIKNWGWFDSQNAETSYPSARARALDYLQQHAAFARTLNKPLVLEEFGAERDQGLLAPDSGTHYRDRYFDDVFAYIAQEPVYAGSNFWAFAGTGRAGKNPERWAPGDDFLGDPPQEPQGLNGVFDTDNSTLDIIAQHARKLARP